MVTNKMGNELNRVWHRHRDLHDGYAAFCDRIGSKVSILGRTHSNGRDDPKFFDPFTNFSSLHNWNLSVRLKTGLPTSTFDLSILYRVGGIHSRKMIVFARKPGVQSWQKKDTYYEVGKKASDNHDCEGALRI